jgi:putative membrane protein
MTTTGIPVSRWRRPVLYGLLGVVVAVLAWSAWRPVKVGTWFFETVWVFAALAVIVVSWRRFPLSTLACCVLAVHAVVLAYGGHYSYARTPLGES